MNNSCFIVPNISVNCSSRNGNRYPDVTLFRFSEADKISASHCTLTELIFNLIRLAPCGGG